MVESIVDINLFVDEKMEIKRNRFLPTTSDNNSKLRVSIVTGIHGDELEGQYVCYQVVKRLNEEPHHINGIIDVYPALNPMGIDSISRELPLFDMDMNRIFPGSENRTVAELMAHRIVSDLEGSDLCIDVHASNIFLKEIMQVRIGSAHQEQLTEFAKLLNVDIIWKDRKEPVTSASLANALNSLGTPTLVIEMGAGMKITRSYGDHLVAGIFNVLHNIGIWKGDQKISKQARIITDDDISLIRSQRSGFFLPNVDHAAHIKPGDLIGEIIDPLNGIVLEEIRANREGQIMTIHEFPVIYKGSLLARVLEVKDE